MNEDNHNKYKKYIDFKLHKKPTKLISKEPDIKRIEFHHDYINNKALFQKIQTETANMIYFQQQIVYCLNTFKQNNITMNKSLIAKLYNVKPNTVFHVIRGIEKKNNNPFPKDTLGRNRLIKEDDLNRLKDKLKHQNLSIKNCQNELFQYNVKYDQAYRIVKKLKEVNVGLAPIIEDVRNSIKIEEYKKYAKEMTHYFNKHIIPSNFVYNADECGV